MISSAAGRTATVRMLFCENGEGESVILDVNLSGLGPYLKLYNSGIKNVLLVESLVKEFGEDGFVTKYLDGMGA